MKEKQAARLKVCCARKESTPFEHLSSDNAQSFISTDHTTDPLLGEHVLLWAVFQQRGEIFFFPDLSSLACQRSPLGPVTTTEEPHGWRRGGWIVMEIPTECLWYAMFPSKHLICITPIIFYNQPPDEVRMVTSTTLQKELAQGDIAIKWCSWDLNSSRVMPRWQLPNYSLASS